jgi:hypothetical protein
MFARTFDGRVALAESGYPVQTPAESIVPAAKMPEHGRGTR